MAGSPCTLPPVGIEAVAPVTFAIIIIRYELLNLRNEYMLQLSNMLGGFYNDRLRESSDESEGENTDYYYRRMYTLDYVGVPRNDPDPSLSFRLNRNRRRGAKNRISFLMFRPDTMAMGRFLDVVRYSLGRAPERKA